MGYYLYINEKEASDDDFNEWIDVEKIRTPEQKRLWDSLHNVPPSLIE